MLVETVLSMLTLVCHFKKVMHRGWAYFTPGSRAPWQPSTCWSNGMAYGPPRRASCPSRLLILVCKIPILLLGSSALTPLVNSGRRDAQKCGSALYIQNFLIHHGNALPACGFWLFRLGRFTVGHRLHPQ